MNPRSVSEYFAKWLFLFDLALIESDLIFLFILNSKRNNKSTQTEVHNVNVQMPRKTEIGPYMNKNAGYKKSSGKPLAESTPVPKRQNPDRAVKDAAAKKWKRKER